MKTFLISLLVVLIGVVSFAQYSVVSYESITVTAAPAVSIGAATLTNVLTNGSCSGRLETAQIRFRIDGTDPTAAEGVLLEIGDVITITKLGNLTRFRAIKTGATNGVLKLHCFQ